MHHDPFGTLGHVGGGVATVWAAADAMAAQAPWWTPLATLALWGAITLAGKWIDRTGPPRPPRPA